ncbi:MAG: 16S rRNA (guanine(527)-N(7))-methyltransferase RsmG [Alphaproteobacteria bacterium]|nr:16S rRNA (guanine(527)-N(7))-methyltransferase RsmG [Alphaproteobacteria bacterium]
MKPPELPPGVAVSRETLDLLKKYQDLLTDWQNRVNLVSKNTIPEAWSRHFVDSLQLLPLIPPSIHHIVDIGSGAGFPGLVMAACRPETRMMLVESTGKKCQFLSDVAQELGLSNVQIMNERVEAVVSRETAPDLVSARALAPLHELLTMIHPWLKKNADLQCLFPKGAKAEDEIAEAKLRGWRFHIKSNPSITEPSAKILWLSGIHQV